MEMSNTNAYTYEDTRTHTQNIKVEGVEGKKRKGKIKEGVVREERKKRKKKKARKEKGGEEGEK